MKDLATRVFEALETEEESAIDSEMLEPTEGDDLGGGLPPMGAQYNKDKDRSGDYDTKDFPIRKGFDKVKSVMFGSERWSVEDRGKGEESIDRLKEYDSDGSITLIFDEPQKYGFGNAAAVLLLAIVNGAKSLVVPWNDETKTS